MAKVKYYAKENSTIGTHSFYAVPIPNGTLTFDELLDEAMDGKSVEPSIAKANDIETVGQLLKVGRVHFEQLRNMGPYCAAKVSEVLKNLYGIETW